MSEASVATPESAGAASQAYILFGVAGTTYALASDHVVHIDMLEHVTPVPNAPAFVEGVVFSRGQVVPVINLRARFGFERANVSPRSRLLVVQHEGRRVGLLADESREFVRISESAIRPPQALKWHAPSQLRSGCGGYMATPRRFPRSRSTQHS